MSDEPADDPPPSSGLSAELQRSHRLAARFCLLELQFANAILDHADIARGQSHHPDSVARARSVRQGLARILEHFQADEDERRIIGAGIAQLDRRLAQEDAGLDGRGGRDGGNDAGRDPADG